MSWWVDELMSWWVDENFEKLTWLRCSWFIFIVKGYYFLTISNKKYYKKHIIQLRNWIFNIYFTFSRITLFKKKGFIKLIIPCSVKYFHVVRNTWLYKHVYTNCFYAKHIIAHYFFGNHNRNAIHHNVVTIITMITT